MTGSREMTGCCYDRKGSLSINFLTYNIFKAEILTSDFANYFIVISIKTSATSEEHPCFFSHKLIDVA